MNFNNFAIGTDIEENSRFEGKTVENDSVFLNKIYTTKEIEYCFSKGVPSQHLCARFCAKEAVVKALYSINIKNVFYKDIEITNDESGAPSAFINKYPDLKIKISLSHSKLFSNSVACILYE